jgi:hypothetical protein
MMARFEISTDGVSLRWRNIKTSIWFISVQPVDRRIDENLLGKSKRTPPNPQLIWKYYA